MRAVRLAEVVQRRAGGQVAIGGVHRHDAVLDLLQERHRIEAADGGVGGIVLHAEEAASRCGRGSPGRCPPAGRTRDTARCRPCSGSPCTGSTPRCSAYSSDRRMPSTVRSMPSWRVMPGQRWPLSVRQWRMPRATQRSMAVRCRSTCRCRSAGSGCVKSGEKQSIDEICPVSASVRRTGSTPASSRLRKKPS